jgi:hypothetical protein
MAVPGEAVSEQLISGHWSPLKAEDATGEEAPVDNNERMKTTQAT